MSIPHFEVGDKVVILDLKRRKLEKGFKTIEHIIEVTDGIFVYALKGMADALYPEILLRLYDPKKKTYNDYFENGYNPYDFDTSEKQVIKIETTYTMNDYLDAYNTLLFFHRLFHDKKYLLKAKRLLRQLENNETINLKNYFPNLEDKE